MRGVIIMGIAHQRIAWARLSMEEAEQGSATIDATKLTLTGLTESP